MACGLLEEKSNVSTPPRLPRALKKNVAEHSALGGSTTVQKPRFVPTLRPPEVRSEANRTMSPLSGACPASVGGLSMTLNSVDFSSKRRVTVDLPPALTTATTETATAHTAAGSRRRRMRPSVRRRRSAGHIRRCASASTGSSVPEDRREVRRRLSQAHLASRLTWEPEVSRRCHMKVFVAGATGALGKQLVPRLVA